MHQAVGGERRLPGIGLVDALGCAVGLDQQILRPVGEAQRHARQRRVRLHVLAGRLRPRRHRAREGGLVAPGAGRIDGAQQHLQQVDRPAGMEAVGMGGDAAHRMHGDRAADHLLVPAAGPVGPGLVDHHLFLEGGMGDLGGDAADIVGCHAAGLGNRVGGVLGIEIAPGQQLEHRHRLAAVRQNHLADQRRREIGTGRGDRCFCFCVPG